VEVYGSAYPKIVVIDSGIDVRHPKLAPYRFRGYGIADNAGGYSITDHYLDAIGHGTAITYIIKKLAPDSDITMVKIFDSELQVSEQKLQFALRFIIDNLDCHIVHMSLGMKMCRELSEFRYYCEQMFNKGIIIVSSFDNDGAYTFPAAFPFVIGVDQSRACKSDYDFVYVAKGEGLNVLAKGIGQKLPWINPPYVMQAGSSYAATYVTGFIANIMKNGITDFDGIHEAIKNQSKMTYGHPAHQEMDFGLNIEKAICFPFNKEIHSLIRFHDLLQFELQAVFDTKYGGKLNHHASEYIGKDIDRDYIIEDYQKIGWSHDFDTVILGHTDLLSEKTGIDYTSYFIEQCVKHGKKIYSFDDTCAATAPPDLVRFPSIKKENIPNKPLGKLRVIGKPVLGIFGTSSMQGKLTLQLKLRRLLLRQGYKVGQLGTEPSSLLYGFDAVYPMGYHSTVEVSGFDSIKVLNHIMGEIEDKSPDIILVGSQSGTIPYSNANITFFTTPQLEFLLGTQPDLVILCVNGDDDTDYVRRTIMTLEGIIPCKVIGIAIFPFEKEISLLQGYKLKPMDAEKRRDVAAKYEQALDKKAFFLDRDADINALWEMIADYFS
jgi:hypothetical protein